MFLLPNDHVSCKEKNRCGRVTERSSDTARTEIILSGRSCFEKNWRDKDTTRIEFSRGKARILFHIFAAFAILGGIADRSTLVA